MRPKYRAVRTHTRTHGDNTIILCILIAVWLKTKRSVRESMKLVQGNTENKRANCCWCKKEWKIFRCNKEWSNGTEVTKQQNFLIRMVSSELGANKIWNKENTHTHAHSEQGNSCDTDIWISSVCVCIIDNRCVSVSIKWPYDRWSLLCAVVSIFHVFRSPSVHGSSNRSSNIITVRGSFI